MTTRDNLTAALEGGTPDTTPLTAYSWMFADLQAPALRRVVGMGLGFCHHCWTVRHLEHGVEDRHETRTEGGDRYDIHTRVTPVGSIRQVHRNGWHHEYFLKQPEDYRVMRWIVEHTEIAPNYDAFAIADAEVGDAGLPVVCGMRSPMMSINVDWAGAEQFCTDVALEVPELFELYEARRKLFMEEARLIAAGPGRHVKWLENLTIRTLGKRRYARHMLPVYEEAAAIMDAGGKRTMVHYDGELSVIADEVRRAPFHCVESLTEPPEGDLTLDECRRAWPEKVFWVNINVAHYALPPEQLRDTVLALRDRAGKRALAFEISEDLPANWETAVPVVLEALRGR